jgi:hypothetical protein
MHESGSTGQHRCLFHGVVEAGNGAVEVVQAAGEVRQLLQIELQQ